MSLSHVLADMARLDNLGDGGLSPTPAELEAAPLIDSYWCGWTERDMMLFGTITGHPTISDGVSLTSHLVAADTINGWIKTRNRYYRLGRHGRDFTADLGGPRGTSA